MKTPPIVTTRDPNLSRWQSAAESLQKFINQDLSISEIRSLPFMQGLYAHVLSTQGKTSPNIAEEIANHAAQSKHFFELVSTQPEVFASTTPATRKYSDDDSEWDIMALYWYMYMNQQDAKASVWYEEVLKDLVDGSTSGLARGWQWLLQSSDKKIQKNLIEYRKWNNSNISNPLTYSLVDWVLPNDAKVVMLGDWGTSNPDCKALLEAIWKQENPDAFVHLGDIYYSGSKEECDDNFYNIFVQVAKDLGKKMVPVFTIPGNHEYYSFGEGFYYLIDKMNSGSQNQEASYFCLRTQDSQWQFLGMDTGQDDNNPYVTHLYPFAPQLYGDQGDHGEFVWHQDKLENFSGNTILMSHHQLFTPDTANLIDSDVEPYFNRYLHGYFSQYFNKIAAWYWGHEHSFAVYQDGIFGLAKGRLLGSSSYEVPDDSGYYDTAYPMVTYSGSFSKNIIPVDADGFYYHTCAVFDFTRTNPTDPINVKYYSYQSWGQDETQTDFALKNIFSETIGASTMPSLKWSGNNKINSKITSNNAPAITQVGHHLYMAYNDSNDSGKIKLSIYNQQNGDNKWTDPVTLSANNNDIYTDHSPSISHNGNTYYLIYADSNDSDKIKFVSNSSNDFSTWGSPSSFGSMEADSAISSVWINGLCYFCFTDKNSTSIIVGYTDFSSIKQLNLAWKPSNIDNPTITANGNTLHLFYTSSTEPSYITWCSLDTNNSNWTQHNWINNGSMAYEGGTPQATTGLSAIVDTNNRMTVFYGNKNVDGDKTINWVTYDNATSIWSGGVSVPRVNGDKTTPFMQHSAASVALSGGGIYVLFVGRSDDSVRFLSRN